MEVLDPMVLSSIVRETDPRGCECPVSVQIPECIREVFDEPLVISGGQRQLFVTLGQFSIVRLEREVQLIVPVLDYALHSKECCDEGCGSAEDPCEMFSRIPFPAQEFSPRNCDSGTSRNAIIKPADQKEGAFAPSFFCLHRSENYCLVFYRSAYLSGITQKKHGILCISGGFIRSSVAGSFRAFPLLSNREP